jgi:hypothetical protein
MLPQALIWEFKSKVGEDAVFADPADKRCPPSAATWQRTPGACWG